MSASVSKDGGGAARLVGRDRERSVVAGLLDAVRNRQSRTLVVCGEAGIGKTALLGDAAARASGFRVVTASGAESEMELAFAALHQLCAPLSGWLAAIPDPQAAALRTTFGITAGPVPDRFLVGLGVLSLLAEAAAEQPVLCLVDDEQWLDRASAQILAFVARRLGAESIGMLFGTRLVGSELAGLPRLTLTGLGREDADALMDSVLTAKLDRRIRDQLVAETHGNPLALVELSNELVTAQIAGGFGLPGAVRIPASAEEMFLRRIRALPAASRRLLLVAAAEPTGDPVLLWRAAERLGISPAAARSAVASGLVELGTRVRFRHPLARSAAYQSASSAQRQQAHAALAEVTDAALDPDRRAWHRAQATDVPDEQVARELERSAGRAQVRGGLSAAGAFWHRAAVLSPDPAQRARRALAGAQARVGAGEFDAALELLAVAEAGPLGEASHASAELIRGQLAFATRRGRSAPRLLLAAAQRLEPFDRSLSRSTYLDAIWAALFAGRLAGPGADLSAVSDAARAAPAAPCARAVDRLLDGLLSDFRQGYLRGLPSLQSSLTSAGELAADDELRLVSLAATAASGVWDDERWKERTARYVRLCRDTGALTSLPLALTSQAFQLLFAGDLSAAATVIEELRAAITATGSNLAPYTALAIAAFRGDEAEVSALARTTLDQASQRGEGWAITAAEWASALVDNGIGHYRTALGAARRATEYEDDLGLRNWAMVELVESATRSGEPDTAARAYRELAQMTTSSGTDWALAVRARSGALLASGGEADDLYREAIERLGRTAVGSELARAHLLYGEWLRRERRRGEARTQLHQAHQLFDQMGMEAFADRARRELWATGETTARRRVDSVAGLTAQESQIARLAREGLTNPEIGTRLFISARTVEYHLSKVFTKLGITSRSHLDRVLP